jgi:Spy/CpxP family protein refolding chaperone
MKLGFNVATALLSLSLAMGSVTLPFADGQQEGGQNVGDTKEGGAKDGGDAPREPGKGGRGRGRGQGGGFGGGPGGGRGGMRMMGGGTLSFAMIASAEKVASELKLTDDQKKSITAINESLRAANQEIFSQIRDADEAEVLKQIVTNTAKANEKTLAALQPEQAARLKGISLQLTGALGVSSDPFASELKITDDQKKSLDGLRREMGEKTQARMQEFFGGGGFPDFAKIQEANAEIQKEFNEKGLAVLTDEQKTKFNEMKGEKLDITMMDIMPRMGGRGGPPGGPGGPPGGPGGRPGGRPGRPGGRPAAE